MTNALTWTRVEGGYDSDSGYTIRRRQGCSRTTGFVLLFDGEPAPCPVPVHRRLWHAQTCADTLNEKRLNP